MFVVALGLARVLLAVQCVGFTVFRVGDVLQYLMTPTVVLCSLGCLVAARRTDMPLDIALGALMLSYIAFDIAYDALPEDWGVPDGTTVIITGANSGVGLGTARILLERGTTVILACRSAQKCAEAAASLRPRSRVHTATLDVSSLASVKAFSQTVLREHPSMSVLINNAGFGGSTGQRTEESTMRLNLCSACCVKSHQLRQLP